MIWLLLSSALASPVGFWGGGWSELSGAGVFLPGECEGWRSPSQLARSRSRCFSFSSFVSRKEFMDPVDVYWDTNGDGIANDEDEPYSVDFEQPDIPFVQIAYSRPLLFAGRHWLTLGFSTTLPVSSLMRAEQFEPSLPNMIFKHRDHVYDMRALIAARPVDGLLLGIGMLSDMDMQVAFRGSFDTQITDAPGEEESGFETSGTMDMHSMTIEAQHKFVPQLSVSLLPGEWGEQLRWIEISGQYQWGRELDVESDMGFDITVQSQDVDGVNSFAFSNQMLGRLLLMEHISPANWSVNLGFKASDKMRLALDARRTYWENALAPVINVIGGSFYSPLTGEVSIADGNPSLQIYRNTLDYGLAFASDIDLPSGSAQGLLGYVPESVSAQLGYRSAQSPVRDLPTNTALLDASKDVFGAGLRVNLLSNSQEIRVGLYGQMHRLRPTTFTLSYEDGAKGRIRNGDEIDQINVEGLILGGGANITVLSRE